MASPCPLHEHLAHCSSGHREKVRAAFPVGIMVVYEPEIRLVNEPCRADCRVPFAAQLPVRSSMQIFVYDRKKFVQRLPISSSQSMEKERHVFLGACHLLLHFVTPDGPSQSRHNQDDLSCVDSAQRKVGRAVSESQTPSPPGRPLKKNLKQKPGCVRQPGSTER